MVLLPYYALHRLAVGVEAVVKPAVIFHRVAVGFYLMFQFLDPLAIDFIMELSLKKSTSSVNPTTKMNVTEKYRRHHAQLFCTQLLIIAANLTKSGITANDLTIYCICLLRERQSVAEPRLYGK